MAALYTHPQPLSRGEQNIVGGDLKDMTNKEIIFIYNYPLSSSFLLPSGHPSCSPLDILPAPLWRGGGGVWSIE